MTVPEPRDGTTPPPPRDAGVTEARNRPPSVRESVVAYLRTITEWRDLRNTPYGLAPMVVLGGAGLFGNLLESTFGLAQRNIARELDVDLTTIIRYFSFIGFVSIFAAIGVAYAADRMKRTTMYGIGLVGAGLCSFAIALARSPLTFGIPLVLSIAFSLLSGVPAFSLLADYYPPYSRGKVFAMMGIAGLIGATILPKISGDLIEGVGWRWVYVVFAAAFTAVAVLALFVLREPVRGYMERRELGADEEAAMRADDAPSFGEAWRSTWGVRTLRRLWFATVWSSAGGSVIGTFLTIIYFEDYGLGPSTLGTLLLIGGLFALPGLVIGGGVADRLMRRRPAQLLGVFGAIGVLQTFTIVLVVLRVPLWILVVVNGLFSLTRSILGPARGAIMAQVVPANIRSLGTTVDGLATIPGTFLLFIAAGLQDSYGLNAGILFAFPLVIVGSVVAMSAAGFFERDMRAAMAANMASEEWRRARRTGAGKMLVCRDVQVHYDSVQVLFGVDFDVEEGSIIALLGTNGAGKSTLLRAIAGVTEASGGAVVFDGRDITHMPPNEVAARGVVLMPGGRGVFPELSVRENLMLGGWLADPFDEADRLDEAYEIFPVLRERGGAPAGTLSGGEQQQLSLAQAFLAGPRLLMIDELSLGLGPAVVAQLLDVVRGINEAGVTVIVVEQSVNVALSIAHKAIFMEKGEVKFFGETAELLRRPDVMRAVYVRGTSTGAVAPRRRTDFDASRTVLRTTDVVKRFGGVTALDHVSLDLREGEVLGVIGPNGSGKTTLFDVISGFQTPDAGRVEVEGDDVTHLGPDQRARRKLVRRFQDAKLFGSLTVYENLLVALGQELEVRSAVLNAAGVPAARRAERRIRRRADVLVETLGLGAYRDKFVRELSTGLRRVADLACVLATDPAVLLLDEPSTGIAQAEAENLAPLFRRIMHETGCSILIIEHDMALVSQTADRLIALDRGRVIAEGAPDDVLDDPDVAEAYLGADALAGRRTGDVSEVVEAAEAAQRARRRRRAEV